MGENSCVQVNNTKNWICEDCIDVTIENIEKIEKHPTNELVNPPKKPRLIQLIE